MAIINIPVGGVAVGIEIPDFAMEYTSQQMLSELKQQTAILQTGTQAQVTALNNLSGGGTSGRLSSAAASNANNNQVSGINRLFTGIEAGFQQLIANAGLQEAVEKMFAGFGMERFGAALGTVVGIVEQTAESMGKLGRIGANAGMSLIDLRDKAAKVGLGLEQVTAFVSTFGTTITSLGKNSTEGTHRLLEFVSELRTATKDVGYFGMSSTEMTQYMIDELEIRRQLNDTMTMQNLNAQQVSTALREQYMQQMAVARLTGQDVHARIRARMDADRDVNYAAAMAGLDERQKRAADAAASALSELGPAVQEMMRKAMTNQFLGMPAPVNNEGFAEFAGVTQGITGLDMIGLVQQVVAASNAGDAEMAQALISQMAIGFDNMTDEQRRQLGVLSVGGGVEGATMALTVAMQATPPVVNAMNASLSELIDAFRTAASEISSAGNMRIAGFKQDSEVMIQQLQASLFNTILGATGTSALNETQSMDALMKVMELGVNSTAGMQEVTRQIGEIMSVVREGATTALEELTPDEIGQGVRNALSDFFAQTSQNIADNRAIMAALLDEIRRNGIFQ